LLTVINSFAIPKATVMAVAALPIVVMSSAPQPSRRVMMLRGRCFVHARRPYRSRPAS
jgi:hypothetical protein